MILITQVFQLEVVQALGTRHPAIHPAPPLYHHPLVAPLLVIICIIVIIIIIFVFFVVFLIFPTSSMFQLPINILSIFPTNISRVLNKENTCLVFVANTGIINFISINNFIFINFVVSDVVVTVVVVVVVVVVVYILIDISSFTSDVIQSGFEGDVITRHLWWLPWKHANPLLDGGWWCGAWWCGG